MFYTIFLNRMAFWRKMDLKMWKYFLFSNIYIILSDGVFFIKIAKNIVNQNFMPNKLCSVAFILISQKNKLRRNSSCSSSGFQLSLFRILKNSVIIKIRPNFFLKFRRFQEKSANPATLLHSTRGFGVSESTMRAERSK